MLVVVLGDWGAGKTLLMCILASKFSRDVYSNFRLFLDNYHPLAVIDLLDLPNRTNIFIDEAYTWLESRVSSSAINKYLSYILFQSRKRDLDIYLSAQMFSSIDIRFRDQSSILILCKRKKKNGSFRYKIINRAQSSMKSFKLTPNKAEKYYSLYDTSEIIEPYNKAELEASIMETNPEALKRVLLGLAKSVKDDIPDGQRITKNLVNMVCLEKGISKSYSTYIWMILNENIWSVV